MNQDFVPPLRINTVYKKETGKLYVFERGQISVFSPAWPRPQAWVKSAATGGWKCFRPFEIAIPGGELDGEIRRLSSDDSGQLLLPFAIVPRSRRRVAQLRWFRDIPVEIRDRISGFRWGWHWHLLSFLARCGKPASELADSNPALAFMLATNERFRIPGVQRPLRAARRLLQKRQRVALEWLGFPGEKSTRQTLARIRPDAVNLYILERVRSILTQDGHPLARKRLRHLPSLNFCALWMICDPQLLHSVSASFLEEVCANPRDSLSPDIAWTLQHAQQLWLLLRQSQRMPVFQRRQAVLDLSNELEDELTSLGGVENLSLRFPAPPVAGDDNIVPICDVRTLVEEGREQHNCVADMLPHILQGTTFVYRVYSPERCTLSLERTHTGWHLGQLKRACNQAPAIETAAMVCRFFEGHIVAHPSVALTESTEDVPF